MSGLIFSTCYINDDITLERIINWFNYYSKLFPDFELISFHDGPLLNPISKDFNIVELTPHLGRGTGKLFPCTFPGWRRSFREALKYGLKYDYVIHIESDLYIKQKYKEKYEDHFKHKNAHYCGYCKIHNIVETAIQVLNNKETNHKFINYYLEDINLNSNICTEHQILKLSTPSHAFIGERLEKNLHSILTNEKNEYFAQFSYNEFKGYL